MIYSKRTSIHSASWNQVGDLVRAEVEHSEVDRINIKADIMDVKVRIDRCENWLSQVHDAVDGRRGLRPCVRDLVTCVKELKKAIHNIKETKLVRLSKKVDDNGDKIDKHTMSLNVANQRLKRVQCGVVNFHEETNERLDKMETQQQEMLAQQHEVLAMLRNMNMQPPGPKTSMAKPKY